MWIRLAVMEGCRNQNLCLTHCLSHCLLHHHRHCQPRTLSRRRLAATNGLRAHKFPPQHSRPAVVVVVEPCAQQRAHAQAHMRARSPTTHHHLLAAGEAGFTWGQPLVKCPNPHARGRGVVHNSAHARTHKRFDATSALLSFCAGRECCGGNADVEVGIPTFGRLEFVRESGRTPDNEIIVIDYGSEDTDGYASLPLLLSGSDSETEHEAGTGDGSTDDETDNESNDGLLQAKSARARVCVCV